MFENFERYLRRQIPQLTEAQIVLLCSKSVIRTVRRKGFLLQEGEVCRHKIFVIGGLLRTYNIGKDGNEHIIRFTAENGFITDPESFINRTPSRYNIQAMETTEAVLWSHENFESLRTSIPLLNTFSERIMTQNISDTQKRILMSISATAEEKYLDFTLSFPDIFRRVPLHMVASYLGVSRETLTRIRQLQRHSQRKKKMKV